MRISVILLIILLYKGNTEITGFFSSSCGISQFQTIKRQIQQQLDLIDNEAQKQKDLIYQKNKEELLKKMQGPEFNIDETIEKLERMKGLDSRCDLPNKTDEILFDSFKRFLKILEDVVQLQKLSYSHETDQLKSLTRPVLTIQVDYQVYSIAYSPNGKTIASSSHRGIDIWDVKTGKQIVNTLCDDCVVNTIAFSADGQYIVAGHSRRGLSIWNAETGKQVGQYSGQTLLVNQIACSPDGRIMVTANGDKTIKIWDAKTGKKIGNDLKGHQIGVKSIAISPDSKWIASGSYDTMMIWDANKGSLIKVVDEFGLKISALIYSHKGDVVASGDEVGIIRIWNPQTGIQVGKSLVGHLKQITSLQFSADDQYLISGSMDSSIRIWNVKQRKQVGESLMMHLDDVKSLSLSPDGKHLASGSEDGTIQITKLDFP